ncbi:MAG: hypothetical protein ACI4JB_06525 [Porcipelethomonas sp.]
MIQVFRYPFVSRNEAAKKVLVRMIPALLLLMLSMVPLFFFIGKDSEENRDTVIKSTSLAAEISAAAVFTMFLLCVVFISMVGIKESGRFMRNFTGWAYYKGVLYNVTAVVPRSHSDTSSRGMRRIVNAQDGAMDFLNDHYTLKKILDGGVENKRILVCKVRELTLLKENRNGVKVLLPDGRKQMIYKNITDYDTLMSIIYGIRK